MKTKLTLKYSSFFFCNSIQLKKGQETAVETDSLSNKDLTILNAYITSGGITYKKYDDTTNDWLVIVTPKLT